jgi:uncharacterized YigZ family protein
MSKAYDRVRAYGRAEYEVKKSLFIAQVWPVKTEAEAQAYLAQVRTEHKDATHNVWAYSIGPGELIQRMSDDGEPSGTAGRPTLEAIRQFGVSDVLVVVTRYFGGVLLGAGGLVRAYGHAAHLGLAAAGKATTRVARELEVTVEYHHWGKIQHLLQGRLVLVRDTRYTDVVTAVVRLPAADADGLTAEFVDLTAGNILVEDLGELVVQEDLTDLS